MDREQREQHEETPPEEMWEPHTEFPYPDPDDDRLAELADQLRDEAKYED